MLKSLLYRLRNINTAATLHLYNERTFYGSFENDLVSCKKELVIESPFLTQKRVESLVPHLRNAVIRGVHIVINTRNPIEHDDYMRIEAELVLSQLNDLGVTILFTGGIHRKLAIIDRKIVWTGSLNILSQNNSCEIMQKIKSKEYARQVLTHIGISEYL